jgi:hypothetical protein
MCLPHQTVDVLLVKELRVLNVEDRKPVNKEDNKQQTASTDYRWNPLQ